MRYVYMNDLTQKTRLIAIKPPADVFADDDLLLTSFNGTESISSLYEYRIEVLSKNHEITPDMLIGKAVSLSIQNKIERQFSGFISSFTHGEVKSDNLRTYYMTMVPWLWFLSRTNNCRIFQELSTKQIISDIFHSYDYYDFEYKASAGDRPREYCVQYDESDFNFISRLLEEDGIAYYFKQEKDKHIMQIVDEINAYQSCIESNVVYSKGNQPDTQLTRWEHAYEFRKGTWTLDDYDFKQPKIDKKTSKSSKFSLAKDKAYEHYSYQPYHDPLGLSELTQKRIEAEDTHKDKVLASGDCSSFYAGGKFNLDNHPVSKEEGAYIITSITHRAYDNSYLAGHDSESGYNNELECIPDSFHYRPEQTHIAPTIPSSQSAIVVGPKGEDIYIDDLGRIKVQFHWDRIGGNNETSSCFLRTMQPWAGNQWGTSFIPRIGMEVIVSFLNGNPDRPFVSGTVYNGDNKVPFNSKTQSGIRTRSTLGGKLSNANELRFDDLKDAEQIYIHAEKNMDTEVENDETLSVDNNRDKKIGVDETSSIGKNRTKTVGEDESEKIGNNKTISVGKDHKEEIANNKTLEVGKDHREKIGNDMDLSVAKNIMIEAGDSITLKTGASSITMKKNGTIFIEGKNITIDGSGKINIKASSTVAIKGSDVTTN